MSEPFTWAPLPEKIVKHRWDSMQGYFYKEPNRPEQGPFRTQMEMMDDARLNVAGPFIWHIPGYHPD